MRKVLIGTPCYDGKVHVEFLHSLLGTMSLAAQNQVALYPVQIAHDALIQRARNDLVRLAIETDCDDLIFIDSDQAWEPEWVFRLLNHPVDVVGGAVPKKSDSHIDFNVKRLPQGLLAPENDLLEVECIGTGFMRISKKALSQVWEVSEPYTNQGKENRLVFNVRLDFQGELVSEDNAFCQTWRACGGKVWVDPSMTCSHIGQKTYNYNFAEFIKTIKVDDVGLD